MTSNQANTRPIIHRSQIAPALMLAHPPMGAAAVGSFGDAMAYLSERLDVSGTVLVSAHWLDGGESPNLELHVIHEPREEAGVVADEIADNVARLLSQAGLTCELAGRPLRSTPCRRTAAILAEGTRRPLVHLSVPVNFGPDLMILAGVALRTVRDCGVMLAGCGDDLTAEVLASANDPLRLKQLVKRAPRQRVADLYPWLLVLAATSPSERRKEILRLPGARAAVLGLHHDTFDLLPARAVITTEGVWI